MFKGIHLTQFMVRAIFGYLWDTDPEAAEESSWMDNISPEPSFA